MKLNKAFILILLAVFTFCLQAPAAENKEVPKEAKKTVDVSSLHYLTPAEKEKLAKNGFVIFISNHLQYYPQDETLSIYHACKNSHFPVFVSSDAILHVSHLLFDWSIRFLETTSLRQDLLNLTDAMLTQSLSFYEQIENKELKNAALKNVIFFNIAKCLLTESKLEEVPTNIKEIIEKELALINKHGGFFVSPLFGYKEDYSQYIPRGHYSRSPEFEKYFKAMMWYGRISFRLTPNETQSDEQALQALLICKALSDAKIKGESAIMVWERIYETTSFFAGRSDDLTVKEYEELMNRIYGENCLVTAIADKKKIANFVEEAKKLRKPRILSTYMTDADDWKTQTQALRFMGQRFTPDSHIFQNLVYNKVQWYTGKDPKPFTAVSANNTCFRGFPRGLDVMAVFGSETAEKILQEEGDASFKGYTEEFSKLKKEYSIVDKNIWAQDLYWAKLWCLKSILEKPQVNTPFFMKSEAWLRKQLNTALSSWAELKHDTIVYTKQPYGMEQRAMSIMGKGGGFLPPEAVHGYVEPVPELYSRVKESIAQLRIKFSSLGFPSDRGLDNNFKAFEEMLNSLETIAKKELAGEMPSETEYELIENIGDSLGRIIRYSHHIDVTENFRSEMDNKMPIIADVYTDVNSSQVLEEGIGRPAEIFVIANVDGKDKVCLGAVYTYYEFKQPMSNRLTDEEWRKMLQENKQPTLPKWIEEFAVTERR